jgi:hypothetical protein
MEVLQNIIIKYPDFSDFDNQSRIWVFQLDKPISDDILININKDIEQYTSTWRSHGTLVKSSGVVISNRFLVLIADENDTSVGGCSQDNMMRFIQQLQADYSVNLLDRFLIYYIDNNEIKFLQMNDLLEKIRNKSLDENTLIFDSLIKTKSEFEDSWIKPFNQSWVNRFL